jgi:hypothetical protein
MWWDVFGELRRRRPDGRRRKERETKKMNRRRTAGFNGRQLKVKNPAAVRPPIRLFDGFLQGFARHKLGNFGGLYFDFRSGLRISARAGFALGHLEGPEADESDIIAFFKRLGDGRQQSVDSGLGIFFGCEHL